MKNNSTTLVDAHLESLIGMKEVGTDDFFYTRLKGRMQRTESGWSLPLKPVWVIGTLVLLLGLNGFMLTQKGKSAPVSTAATVSSIQDFASSYDQTISSY